MNITANGRYTLDESFVTGRASIYASGTFGGATVELQYKDAADNYITLDNGTFTDQFQEVMSIGTGQDLYVNVTGGTGIDIYIEIGAIP